MRSAGASTSEPARFVIAQAPFPPVSAWVRHAYHSFPFCERGSIAPPQIPHLSIPLMNRWRVGSRPGLPCLAYRASRLTAIAWARSNSSRSTIGSMAFSPVGFTHSPFERNSPST